MLKYDDLLIDEDNCNFTIEVLSQIMIDHFKEPFSKENFFFILSGAKGFGKTFLICILAWFFTCNFKDYNCLLSRYTFNSARESYSSTMLRVANILEKYGVTITKYIDDKIIKSYNSENRCEWVWPNGRVIRVIGFDNSAKWEGVPAKIGEWGMFALDEVIPLKDKIKNEEEYINQLFNILIQIVRGENLVTSSEIFSELTFENFSIRKKHLVIFGFNNHNTDHPIYQLFVNSIIPLTEEVKQEMKDNKISFQENKEFLNVGAIVVRGTTAANDNLNPMLYKLAEGIKELSPEVYETLFMGGESEMSIDQYSYKKDLIENAKFYDHKEFFWKDTSNFYFDEIRIGCDYADGGDRGDDAVTIALGFEIFDDVVKGIYVLEEQSINTRKFKNMVKKVEYIASAVTNWAEDYEHTSNRLQLKDSIKFRIGHDSRTVKDFLKQMLVEKFDFGKDVVDIGFSTFHATGIYGWSIADRHYVWKRLLSEGKMFFSKRLQVSQTINGTEIITKPYGHLYDALLKCKNHPDKKIRDERPKENKLDAINAAEHALSYFRYKLFEN